MVHGFLHGTLVVPPDVESRWWLVTELEELSMMWMYPVFGLYFLFLAMPLIAARHSPVATVCLAVPAACVLWNVRTVCAHGNVSARAQHELARGVLERAGKAR